MAEAEKAGSHQHGGIRTIDSMSAHSIAVGRDQVRLERCPNYCSVCGLCRIDRGFCLATMAEQRRSIIATTDHWPAQHS